MKVLDLLIGKSVNIMTDALVEVQLEIKKVEEKKHSEDLEKPSRKNDWWPQSKDWTTYEVTFTNGFVKNYNNLTEINLIN